jgi:hypothetical protein
MKGQNKLQHMNKIHEQKSKFNNPYNRKANYMWTFTTIVDNTRIWHYFIGIRNDKARRLFNQIIPIKEMEIIINKLNHKNELTTEKFLEFLSDQRYDGRYVRLYRSLYNHIHYYWETKYPLKNKSVTKLDMEETIKNVHNFGNDTWNKFLECRELFLQFKINEYKTTSNE